MYATKTLVANATLLQQELKKNCSSALLKLEIKVNQLSTALTDKKTMLKAANLMVLQAETELKDSQVRLSAEMTTLKTAISAGKKRESDQRTKRQMEMDAFTELEKKWVAKLANNAAKPGTDQAPVKPEPADKQEPATKQETINRTSPRMANKNPLLPAPQMAAKFVPIDMHPNVLADTCKTLYNETTI